MLRRLGIRGKVLAALSVPVVVLFLLAGLVSWQAIQEVRSTRAVQDVLEALEQSRLLAQSLQEERSVSLALFGPAAAEVSATTDLESVRQATDTALNRFQRAAREIDFDALDPTTKATFDGMNAQLGALRSTRAFVDVRQVAMLTIDQGFSSLIGSVAAFPQRVADGLSDRELAKIVATGSEVFQLMEAYEHEQVLGREVLRLVQAGLIEPTAVNDTNLQALSDLIAQNDEFRLDVSAAAYSLGTETAIAEVVLSTSQAVDQFPQMRRDLRNLTAVRLLSWAPDEWSSAAQAEIEEIAVVSEEIDSRSTARANVVANAAIREAALSISVTALAVVLSVVIALSIARAIVRPVRRLTEAATTVRDELPNLVEQVAIPGQGPDLRLTKIPVESRDEIGQLAQAFNEVNQTTIEVAQEQAALRASIAEMFVNVARRDQVLLNRQLSFIDALERAEEDPKTLADLFRLDHLATRMRRNSESLLVLAGIDTGRRLREPLPTSDVIRTASSEIEHYERIQLELPVDPLMLGHTALPTAHMLAELLENATVFSDPGTPVHVSTGIDEEAVIITILDQGLGMTPEELAQANSRLQTSSASDVLGAQRLGLYVVGRISARLGAKVTLGLGPDGKGTLVTVRMPLVLFVNPGELPITPPTTHARVETFVRPEEAAGAVHDTAYAPPPAPTQVQDVPAGALGSAENPAEPVDIAALTEGTTETGLPKRRTTAEPAPAWDMSAGNPAAASAIPLAPAPEALATAASGMDEVWTPPVVATSTPLVPRRRPDDAEAPAAQAGAAPEAAAPAAEAPASPLPQRARSTASGLPVRGAPAAPEAPAAAAPAAEAPATTPSGLPTRRPAAPVPPPAPEPTSSAPSSVEGRTAMFAGFRSRRAELAAAAVAEGGAAQDAPTTDAVERLAAQATGAAAFFSRNPQPAPAEEATTEAAEHAAPAEAPEPAEEPMVIPALVEDEDEFGDAAFAPQAPAAQVPGTEAPAAEAPAAEVPAEPSPYAEAQPSPYTDAQPASPYTDAQPADGAPWPPAVPAAAAPAAQDDFPIFEPTPTPTYEPPSVQPAASAAPVFQPAPVAEAPAAAAPAEPVAPAPAAQVPAPAAEAPAQPAPVFPTFATETPDFAELVHGPTRRSLRESRGGRRRWFRRSRKDEAAEVITPAPAATAPASPAAGLAVPAPARPASDAAPVAPSAVAESPVRQSAWGGAPQGTHASAPAAAAEPAPAPEPERPPRVVWTPQPASDLGWQAPEAPQWTAPPSAPASPLPSAPAPAAGPATPSAPVTPTVPEPRAAVEQAWQPAAAPGWQPEPWPEAEAPSAPEAPAAPSAAPAAPAASAAPAAPSTPAAPTTPTTFTPAPAAPPSTGGFGGATTFTPQPIFGVDEEMTSMLAQRADIAQQALAELNQLSTYRPQTVSGSGAPKLARRTPSAIPAAPAIAKPSSPRPARDANQVRSLLSSFQSGTARGRQLAGDGAQTTGAVGRAGSSEGPEGRGEPVTTPDTDLPRDTTW
jgi:signal transduction histidine kinase